VAIHKNAVVGAGAETLDGLGTVGGVLVGVAELFEMEDGDARVDVVVLDDEEVGLFPFMPRHGGSIAGEDIGVRIAFAEDGLAQRHAPEGFEKEDVSALQLVTHVFGIGGVP